MTTTSGTSGTAGPTGPSGSTSQERTTLRRSLSVWQAVGISVALMAPSMAANINPQGTAGLVGRATPLAFFLAAVAVLLIAYVFVRLCQYYRHAGSVYVFAGATLGARAGAVAGFGLMGTYVFYALVTASAAGIFGASFLDVIGLWTEQPDWAGFVVGGIALTLALILAVVPARRAAAVLLSVEGATVALIVVIAVVVFARLLTGNAPNGATFTLAVFTVPPDTDASTLFLGIIFGLLSFAGFEAAATLGEEAREPRRDIPRAILGTAIFGGAYFTFVTAVEMMAFKPDEAGVQAFIASPALMGDLGRSYIAAWVGDLITLGAAVSAFGCCLACVVGASRLLFAISRDLAPGTALARTGSNATPTAAAATIAAVVVAIAAVCALAFGAKPFDTFLWSGTIGTLILLVAYVLATVGCIKLIWIDKKMAVPAWQVVIPVLALVMLLYTIYRNVFPYPDEGPPRWFPVVAFGWLALVTVVVLAVPGLASRLAAGLRALDRDRDEPAQP
jgi:amino acid transporter